MYDVLKRMWVIVACAGALTVMFAGQQAAAQDNAAAPNRIDWLHSYSEAVRLASTSDRSAIVEFYTDWCPWCRRLEDSTFMASSVIAMTDKYVFARVNAELDTALATQFGVSSYPTVILFDKAGNEVGRIVGYVPPDRFVKTMNDYVNGVGTLWALEQAGRDKRNDPEIAFKTGEIYMQRGDFKQARANFDQVLRYDLANNLGWSDNAQFDLGVMLRKERDWFKAIEAFRKLIKNYPESELAEDAQLYIAWLNERAGAPDDALEEYKTFLDEYSKSSETDWVKAEMASIKEAKDAKQASDKEPADEQ